MGLDGKRKLFPNQMSGGEQQGTVSLKWLTGGLRENLYKLLLPRNRFLMCLQFFNRPIDILFIMDDVDCQNKLKDMISWNLDL